MTLDELRRETDDVLEHRLRELTKQAIAFNKIALLASAREAMALAERVHRVLLERHQVFSPVSRGVYR